MIYINEWLPNPAGSDAQNEWVELFNNGSGSVDLSGWQIKTAGGSKVALGGEIGTGQYAILHRAQTKLVLKNTDEGLFLYDVGGKLIDQSPFFGRAPEGKSFSKFSGVNSFVWSDPTPGAQNKISLEASIAKNVYPAGVALNHPLDSREITLLALGVGIIFAAIIIFIIKQNANLSKSFFGKN